MKILSALVLAASVSARYPSAQQPGILTLEASGSEEPGTKETGGVIDSLQAGAVRGYQTASGPLQWVRATDNFLEAGQLVQIGNYVEVRASDAKWLESQDRAVMVDQAEVDKAAVADATRAAKAEKK